MRLTFRDELHTSERKIFSVHFDDSIGSFHETVETFENLKIQWKSFYVVAIEVVKIFVYSIRSDTLH